LAVTVTGADTVRTQVPVPEHPPPLQPVKMEPEAPLAVRVTAVPLGKMPEQLAPQVIPVGTLVTVPLPAPVLRTARPKTCGVVPHAIPE
jgi:hypothetical protein